MQLIKNMNPKKVMMMLCGILLIGIGVAAFRLGGFGVDPFTCMNLGISGYLGMSFGTWQLIANIIILIAVFFLVPHFIGLGTIINMVFVGYIADFLCWIITQPLSMQLGIVGRIVCLCIGMAAASFGAALYMESNLGISPYDTVAFIIQKLTKEKISFRLGRVLSDVSVVVVGLVACLAAQNNIWEIIGLGTIINALLNGPLIQFFRNTIKNAAC